jgi:hypothetical protein
MTDYSKCPLRIETTYNATVANALRDWDYMLDKRHTKLGLDPFKLVSSQWRDAYIMDGAEIYKYISPQKKQQRLPNDLDQPDLPEPLAQR